MESKIIKNNAVTNRRVLAGVRVRIIERFRKLRKQIGGSAKSGGMYQLPTLRFASNGARALVTHQHCAFYPGSTAIETHKDELKDYELSKGTIRFQPNNHYRPLVRTIVKNVSPTTNAVKKHR